MYYSPPSLSERAAAFDAITQVIGEYLPKGNVTAWAALDEIVAIVEACGVRQSDEDQLALPLAA